MARALDHPPTAPGRDLLELVDAALQARGILTVADAVALLAPLPATLEAARADDAPLRLPPRTNRDTRAVLAALGLVDAPRKRGDGPVPYRAPERGPEDPPTPRSDVYAVAGLLRTAVTGHDPPPWTLETLPSAANVPALSGTFGAVLWDALADDPAQRPATPAALLDAASAAAAGRTIPAAATPAAPPDAQRLRLAAAAAAGAFFLGMLLVTIGGGQDAPSPPRPVALLPAGLTPDAAATGTDAAYSREFAATMRRLNRRRVARRERLFRATTLAGQSRSATALADAYGLAARAARRAPVPARASSAHADIVEAMRLTESGYRTMARGARDGDRAQYVRGRDAVRRREALLQRRIQRLERLGFEVR